MVAKSMYLLITMQNFGQHAQKMISNYQEAKERLDPVLNIYIVCRVMLTTNIDVKNGQANGTQAFIESVQL